MSLQLILFPHFSRTDKPSSQHRGTARNVCLQQPGSRPRCRGSVSQRKHPWGNPPRRQAASDSCWGAASYTFLECGATGATGNEAFFVLIHLESDAVVHTRE